MRQPKGAVSRGILGGLTGALLLFAPTARSQTVSGLAAERVASGLDQPLFVTAPPNDFSRLFIVLRKGQVLTLDLATGTVGAAPFLDISSQVDSTDERGLLGMAFDPNYSNNGRFYLNYVAPGGAFGKGVTHVSQFTISKKHKRVLVTEKFLLSYDQLNGDHNGGWIGFSPRARDANNLYIATGDGGCCNDQGGGHMEPGGNGQSTTTLLGKILRIHLGSKNHPYSIPPDNPFFGSRFNRPEIWTRGFRNPFRASFDRETGTMFIGEVGQETREEIDVQKATNPGGGENFGWRRREGTIATPTGNPMVGGDPPAGSVDPILDYPRSVGGTVIGGYIYRGKQIPALQGTYVFGDFLASKIFALNYDGSNASNFQDITSQLFPTGTGGYPLGRPSSFGEDANGEIYVADINEGSVYKIVPGQGFARIESVTLLENGHTMVKGSGVPFKSHTIEATPDLAQAFVTVGVVTAEGDGTFQFEYRGNLTSLHYRVVPP
jgi:glucose/arabinose dehydrogenase